MGLVRSLVFKSKFHIKRGYKHRTKVEHFDDISNKDEYQREVYQKANTIFVENRLSSVLDIGCGSGFKLLKHFGKYDFIGVEVEPTLGSIQEKYGKQNFKSWEEIKGKKFDLVICSDVIEHVLDPSNFILEIVNNIKFDYLVISTPERDLVRGSFDYGPPRNPYHFREWNYQEFNKFIGNFVFIINHEIVNEFQGTQLICAKMR